MIEVQSLRVGSYYLYKGKEIKFDVSDFNEINHNLLDLLEPIELTEEWLLKFGFEKDIDSWFYSFDYDENKETFKIFERAKENIYSIIDVNNFGIEIKYAHRLQNIYFALTDKELTIKET